MQGLTKTGLLETVGLKIEGWFDNHFLLVGLALLVGIGSLSSLLANIPVVTASLVMMK